MSADFQQHRSENSEGDLYDAPTFALGHVRERELARRSHLLLAENTKWLSQNSDKLVSSCIQPNGPATNGTAVTTSAQQLKAASAPT
jgi:hypothetical protein